MDASLPLEFLVGVSESALFYPPTTTRIRTSFLNLHGATRASAGRSSARATLRGRPGKFGHGVAAKRCLLSGCGVAMVSLFWFSSCRWEGALPRAQVSVSLLGCCDTKWDTSLLYAPYILASKGKRSSAPFGRTKLQRSRDWVAVQQSKTSRLIPSFTPPLHLRAPVSTWSGKIQSPPVRTE